MNSNQIIKVYEIFKKMFSIDDSMEIMSFIEDAKSNRNCISTDRKLKVCEIFEKAFSGTDANTILTYIIAPQLEKINTGG
jgi:hypothetical protein